MPRAATVSAASPGSRRGGVVAAALVGAVLVVGLAGGGLFVVLRGDDGDRTASPALVDAGPGAAADDAATAEDPVEADSGAGEGSTSIEPTTTSEATTTTTDPGVASESDALVRLQDIAADDASDVNPDVVDRWVPQVSSKKPGVTLSDGTMWDAMSILEDHEEWRSRFPDARLVWSGDYSTFEAQDFWVTIVAVPFDTPEGALGWCDAQGLPVEDCYAKLISSTHPNEDSTRHR